MAAQDDSWSLLGGAQWMSDSNLFRKSQDATSDTFLVTTGGFRINKPYSQQRLVINATASDYKFDKSKQLNHVAKNGSANWQWALTPNFFGNLSASYLDQLNNFVDYQQTLRNIRTTKKYRFDAEWLALGRFRLLGAADHIEVSNSQVINEDSDNTTDAYEFGVKYQLPSGSNLAVVTRQVDGKYTHRALNPFALLDTGFQESRLEARALLIFSEKTRVSTRIGQVERKHDNFSQRDYSGTIGALDYSWQVTDKLLLNANWEQSYDSYQNAESSYFRRHTKKVSAGWQLSSMLTLRGNYQEETRDYLGALITVSDARRDKLKTTSVSLEWSPNRTLTLALTGQQQQRNTNASNLDFKSDMYGVSANISF